MSCWPFSLLLGGVIWCMFYLASICFFFAHLSSLIRLLVSGLLFPDLPTSGPPQVTWIGIGGFVFFGVYEGSKAQLMGLGV